MFVTIKEMLDLCRDNPDAQVGFAPTGSGSWRGAYNEPCLYVEVGTLQHFQNSSLTSKAWHQAKYSMVTKVANTHTMKIAC